VPDKEARVTITPQKAGQFAFFCDVFCGDGHEEMGGTLIVEA
jgi:cytochrome c oxidase subunit II